MLPSKLFFDNFFDDLEAPKKLDKMMKCDIYEKEGKYNIEMDLPGFKKENINLDYKDGYLKISAVKEENENEDKKYIRRERSISECERDFYVGDIDESLIKASFKDGILTVVVPKEEDKKDDVVDAEFEEK